MADQSLLHRDLPGALFCSLFRVETPAGSSQGGWQVVAPGRPRKEPVPLLLLPVLARTLGGSQGLLLALAVPRWGTVASSAATRGDASAGRPLGACWWHQSVAGVLSAVGLMAASARGAGWCPSAHRGSVPLPNGHWQCPVWTAELAQACGRESPWGLGPSSGSPWGAQQVR